MSEISEPSEKSVSDNLNITEVLNMLRREDQEKIFGALVNAYKSNPVSELGGQLYKWCITSMFGTCAKNCQRNK